MHGRAPLAAWDNHGLESFHPYQSYSCHLPPGVEINVVGYDYD